MYERELLTHWNFIVSNKWSLRHYKLQINGTTHFPSNVCLCLWCKKSNLKLDFVLYIVLFGTIWRKSHDFSIHTITDMLQTNKQTSDCNGKVQIDIRTERALAVCLYIPIFRMLTLKFKFVAIKKHKQKKKLRKICKQFWTKANLMLNIKSN